MFRPFIAHLTDISLRKGLSESPPSYPKYLSNNATRTPASRSRYIRLLIVIGPNIVASVVFCISRFSKRSKSRSEEHTSELQSRDHHICLLLLENKNNYS